VRSKPAVSEDYVKAVSAKQFGADPSFGGQNVLNDLNFLNELNSF
jgi:hypothetical protein